MIVKSPERSSRRSSTTSRSSPRAASAYELAIPLSAYEALPQGGRAVLLHTHLVVKEDGWQLFGFTTPYERRVFQKVLDAKGVGPALALGLLSSLTAERLVRAFARRTSRHCRACRASVGRRPSS